MFELAASRCAWSSIHARAKTYAGKPRRRSPSITSYKRYAPADLKRPTEAIEARRGETYRPTLAYANEEKGDAARIGMITACTSRRRSISHVSSSLAEP
jgi:hypothetical protein